MNKYQITNDFLFTATPFKYKDLTITGAGIIISPAVTDNELIDIPFKKGGISIEKETDFVRAFYQAAVHPLFGYIIIPNPQILNIAKEEGYLINISVFGCYIETKEENSPLEINDKELRHIITKNYANFDREENLDAANCYLGTIPVRTRDIRNRKKRQERGRK